MDSVNLLGLLAGTLTTASFLPQLIKVMRTRSTRDISLLMYLVITVGVFMWLIFGLCTDSLPVIAANAVTLVIASAILVMKIRFR
jgi:MtN3 and saliva related transmembrane protein